jgi:hypothetical protein
VESDDEEITPAKARQMARQRQAQRIKLSSKNLEISNDNPF